MEWEKRYIFYENQEEVPIYEEGKACGFLEEAGTFPKRKLSTDRLAFCKKGIYIEEDSSRLIWTNENHYNYGGMAFKMEVPQPGSYQIRVKTWNSPEEVSVMMKGMLPTVTSNQAPWDAAHLVKKTSPAKWDKIGEEYVWEYQYVIGSQSFEVEIEPKFTPDEMGKKVTRSVGISEISIRYIPNQMKGDIATCYLLGDSTVKSYVFEEAPMFGWGQIFYRFFDEEKFKIVNYSQGGRSLKTMYQEGRLNDILVAGKPGDYILIQSGHNDESRNSPKGIEDRFGRGNTEETFKMWLREYFVPAILARGMKPIFVSCMTRIDNSEEVPWDNEIPVLFAGFSNGSEPGIDFPKLMMDEGKRLGIPTVDLYKRSIDYINSIGWVAAKSMFLSLEAGETPGKTNSGSYANGNPSQNCDGTHYKECLAKIFAQLVVSELEEKQIEISSYLKEEIKETVHSGNWQEIFPEQAKDTLTGENAYYRNQIEKMIQLSALKKDEEGYFHPKKAISCKEYINALAIVWELDENKIGENIKSYIGDELWREIEETELTVEIMGVCMNAAYRMKFGKDSEGNWIKPKYMTDYNKVILSSKDANYDSNLDGESAQYDPLITWEELLDRDTISKEYLELVKESYELGFLRVKNGVVRGKMVNGKCLEPGRIITRELAAKSLYFLWVLKMPVKREGNLL